MTKNIIALDSEGIYHTTEKGNGSNYCRERSINLDWSGSDSAEGVVLTGGVYFKCRECGATGVLTSSKFTLDLKRKVGISARAPLGIEFYSCDNHEGINEDE